MAAQPTSWLQNLGIAIEVVCPVLSLIVVSLRLYIRIKTGNFGWDDAWILGAMALSIAMAIGSVLVMKLLYIGIHYWDVPATFDPTRGLLWIYIVGALYNPILAIVKQSVLIFLLRLSGPKTGVRTAVWIVSAFNVAEMIAIFLVVIFQCSPIAANWDLALAPSAKCVNQSTFGLATGVLTILTDLATLAIPIYIFFGLRINRRIKLALILVFMLGFAVTAVSIVRLYFLRQHLVDTSPDANYSVGFCVSAIECNLAIITACGPAMWPLLRTWMPGAFRSLGAGYQRNNAHGDIDWNTSRRVSHRGATATIGGTSFELNNIKDVRGDKARGKTEIRARAIDDSDEEVLMHPGTGIMMTTDYSVARGDKSSLATSSRTRDATDAKEAAD